MSITPFVTLLTGLFSKGFLKFGCKDLKILGLPYLLDALDNPNVGVLTVSNHISVMDDPLMWGFLPLKSYIRPQTHLRYTLGASNICFTNPISSAFFTAGQTLCTYRGDGIYQESIDQAIGLLREGKWVHIFPEGKVNQNPNLDRHIVQSTTINELPPSQPIAEKGEEVLTTFDLLRFKWGISRIILESSIISSSPQPIKIIPIWISGFDKVMPMNRSFPRFLPRLNANITINIGAPIKETTFSYLNTPKIYSYPSSRPKPPLYGGEPEGIKVARMEIATSLRNKLSHLGKETEAMSL